MKIEFQNPIVRLSFFVAYNRHKKCFDNPCWGNILYFERSKQKCLQSWTKF